MYRKYNVNAETCVHTNQTKKCEGVGVLLVYNSGYFIVSKIIEVCIIFLTHYIHVDGHDNLQCT